jgi:hypothetical protein
MAGKPQVIGAIGDISPLEASSYGITAATFRMGIEAADFTL